jgi:hypothetical protein
VLKKATKISGFEDFKKYKKNDRFYEVLKWGKKLLVTQGIERRNVGSTLRRIDSSDNSYKHGKHKN